MLLTYLYENFLETREFAAQAHLSTDQLHDLTQRGLCPDASYRLKGSGQVTSFIGAHTDTDTYHFHLKGHLAWVSTIGHLGIDTEGNAHAHFFARYDQAKTSFLTSALGRDLIRLCPDIPARFDTDYAAATWGNFKQGVYGLCTRDGQPESIFVKQACVLFIEQIIADMHPENASILARAVAHLERVESDFAPHEVAQSSRQRCIIDVKTRYLEV